MSANPTHALRSEPDFRAVKSLFEAVVDLPETERKAALDKLTDDPKTIAAVLEILAAGATDSQTAISAIYAVSDNLIAGGREAELAPGDIVGAWKLLEEIGRGGMGSVFLVARSDGHFEQRAALKLLAGFATERAMLHLSRERQILAALNHPNIARLLDGGATPRGRPYLVLEHIVGEAIDSYCAHKILTQTQVITLFIDACKAVAFAHRQLVVHCDLKPSNILVTKEGRPVLLDFGVSRLMGANADESALDAELNLHASLITAPNIAASATLTGAAYTPRYASPEQKAGERVGMATDVYSLGLMLAEILGIKITMLAPLNAQSLSALPVDLAAIILRAVEPTPDQRYGGADALADDLARYLSHAPVAARAATPLYLATKFARRNWPWLVVASTFLATISLFSWRTITERDNARAAETTARTAERAAREVKDYMISVFQGADPEISGQRDLPVSALLDAGRERMTTKLADQPQTRAEMTGILAAVYHKIGKRDQALAMLDEAIALERKNNRLEMLADLLHKKAAIVYDMEDFPKAEVLARDALKMRESVASESMAVSETQQLLGRIFNYLERVSDAEVMLKKGLDLAVKLKGETSVEAARAFINIGAVVVREPNRAKDGEAYAQKARDIIVRLYSPEHFLYADAQEITLQFLLSSNRYDEAVAIAKELSEKRAKLHGEISNQHGLGLYTYASVLQSAGQRLAAIPVLNKCVLVHEKLDGRATLAAAYPLQELAKLYGRVGNFDAAATLATEVLNIRSKLLPKTDVEFLSAQYDAGRFQRAIGNLSEAERLSTAALKMREAAVEPRGWDIAISKMEVISIYRLQRRYDEANVLLSQMEKDAKTQSPGRAAGILLERARLAAAQGQNDLALEKFNQAGAMFMKDGRDKHPDSWLPRIDHAEFLLKLGKREAARNLAKQIAEIGAPSIYPDGLSAKRLEKLIGKRKTA